MHRYEMEEHLRDLGSKDISFTWATNVMSRQMEGADLCLCAAGRTTYELAHMRVPAMVLATHERELRHSFARAGNGFAFLGLGERVSDDTIRRVFLKMLDGRARQRFYERMKRLDFTGNKARVIALMLGILNGRKAGQGEDACAR